MIEWKAFEFNPFSENTYIVWDNDTREAWIIDPGCYDSSERKIVFDFLRNNSLDLKYILNTHCHLDHIFGNRYIKENFQNCILIIPERELGLYESGKSQAEMFGLEMACPPEPDRFFLDDEVLNLGGAKFRIISTPGHSEDGKSFYSESAGICFTGDALFHESIGRTDLPGGNLNVLISTIKDKLFVLPDKTVILAGHGQRSFIGHEKLNNPFLRL
ncbi:MAG: MBL fold metallo-hydrolase [Ignavibacteriaceae bacterium]|nr:MBL fold metallo-hydrolase [Ignavibacteriaceae bacterium]